MLGFRDAIIGASARDGILISGLGLFLQFRFSLDLACASDLICKFPYVNRSDGFIFVFHLFVIIRGRDEIEFQRLNEW